MMLFLVLGLFCSEIQAPAGNVLARQEAVLAEGKVSIPSLLAQYEATMRKEPANPEGYVLAAAVYPRAESRALYRKAIELAPDYAPAHLGLARYLKRE